jgi:hypothetical protein
MTNKRVFENADELWGEVSIGSTFSSASTPGVYYLLSGIRRTYGARSLEFHEIKRGSVTKAIISDAAMEGRGWFPLSEVWCHDGEVNMSIGDRYYRGVPMRVHLKTQHSRLTKAPVLSEGWL